VKKTVLKSLLGALMLGALLSAPARADSQAAKPVVVISTAGYDAFMADLACLGEIGDHPGLDKSIDGIVKLFTKGRGLAGVDKARPWGIAFFPGDGKPTGYGFVPVTDLKALLELLDELGHKSSDAGAGLIEIDMKQKGKRLLVREGMGWAFLADSAESLANLPDDPGKMVADVAEHYDWAVQLNISNVSPRDREKLVKALGAQAKKDLDKAKGTEAQKAVLRMIAGRILSDIETAAEELERITIGGSLDNEAKTASLEVTVTALEGTGAAAKLAQLKQSTTNLAGFQLPGAAMTAGCAVQCSNVNTEMVTALFLAIKTVAFEEIDRKIDSEQKAARAKEFIGGLLRVAAETVATGRLDRRMSLVLKPGGVTLVGASHVASGPKLEQTLAMLVEVAHKKYGDDVDEIFTPNAEEYNGVRLHVLSIPITERCKHHEDAIALVGEKLEVVFGVADEAVGFAAGRDAMKTMKQAIDRSIASPQQATVPAQFSVSLGRVADFMVTVAEEKDKAIVEAAAAIANENPGKDHISSVVTPIDRGLKYQFQIEEAVLKLLAEARKLKGK
jgi:hypothetical protein